MTAGLVIGAPRSGSGKTTITLAILAALRERGVRVRGAKSGPDYIDPAFHQAATGAASFNLDTWAMDPTQLASVARTATQGADLLVLETAMGLFDGVDGEPLRSGAGADVAARLGLPVVLVLDVSGQSRTAAAVARGFVGHQEGVEIAGVILNRIASPRHLDQVRPAIERIGLKVIGAVPRKADLVLPERHLGLVQAEENPDLAGRLAVLAEIARTSIDLDALIALARPARTSEGERALIPPPGQRIALARDAAFSFIYAHHTAAWRAAGAEILPFSPLADEAPDPSCDLCWLAGGYPELHAGRLAANHHFLDGLRAFAERAPVHGECGGHMVLGQGLIDAEGERHGMAGLLSHTTSFKIRRMNLGYRRAVLLGDAVYGAAGEGFRGHEFHYASTEAAGDDPAFARLFDSQGKALGEAGGRRGRVSGTFFHVIAREADAPRK